MVFRYWTALESTALGLLLSEGSEVQILPETLGKGGNAVVLIDSRASAFC